MPGFVGFAIVKHLLGSSSYTEQFAVNRLYILDCTHNTFQLLGLEIWRIQTIIAMIAKLTRRQIEAVVLSCCLSSMCLRFFKKAFLAEYICSLPSYENITYICWVVFFIC